MHPVGVKFAPNVAFGGRAFPEIGQNDFVKIPPHRPVPMAGWSSDVGTQLCSFSKTSLTGTVLNYQLFPGYKFATEK